MAAFVLVLGSLLGLGGMVWKGNQELTEVRQDHAVLLHKLDQILQK
jgi:hypothetical protein